MKTIVFGAAFLFGSSALAAPAPLKPWSGKGKISTDQIKQLPPGTQLKFEAPRRLEANRLRIDDGDTIFFAKPKDGTFRVQVNGQDHRIHISDQQESPRGMVAVRFMGVDTPETHVPVTGADGKKHYEGQGKPGEIAANATRAILGQAERVEVGPAQKRPFDYYNRMLGHIYAVEKTSTGKERRVDVNRWLLSHGHGEMYAFYNGDDFSRREFDQMSAASRRAVERGLGIYGAGDERITESPADFRRRVQNRASHEFVADMAAGKIYRGEDAAKIAVYNRLWMMPSMVEHAEKKLGLTLADGVTLNAN